MTHRTHIGRSAAAVALCFAAAEAFAAGVSVIPEAAFSGDRGMRILMNNTDPGYVEDETPTALKRYRARFWINVDQLDLGTSQDMVLLQALNGADEMQFQLRLREETGANRVNFRVLLDNATTLELAADGEPTLAGGWNRIELDWRAATVPGQNDGHFHLTINGNVVPALDGIDTDQRQVDKVRLGFVTLLTSGAIEGSFDIDEFVSRNADPIGAAPTTNGIADVSHITTDPPLAIDLFAAFDDTEDADAALTYTVQADTNPAIFDSTLVDGAAGTLTLDLSGAAGNAEVTVRATDTDALFVETTFAVDITLASPTKASNPEPADETENVPLEQDLSWTAGERAATHRVHFGTADPPPFIAEQPETTFEPGALTAATTYFWRIDEANDGGVTEGDVWSFRAGLLGDVNGDGAVDAVDIQLVINAALGVTPNPAADLNDDGDVNAVDIQLVINTALGL